MNKIYTIVKIIVLTLLFTAQANAQDRLISGTVKDAESKEPLAYCSIKLLNSYQGTSTDGLGRFRLNLSGNAGSDKIAISYLGYATDTVSLVGNKKDYEIFLTRTPGNFNEIVVSGVSKATLIKENPISIVSVSPKAIDQTTSNNIIDDLAQNVPGLTPVKTGPNVSKPFINGLGYNRVLTLYDGMRVETQQWGDEHGVPVDDYNIEKAEVIRGPASLMYGSDALAGVVSLFPPIPHTMDGLIHGRFLSEYQSNNGLIGNALRLEYSNQHWVWSIRGSQRIAKNYQNSVDGRVYNTGFQMENISGLIGYNSEKGYSRLNFTAYDNLQGIPDGSRDSITRQFTKQVSEIPDDNIKSRPIVTNQELNSYDLSPLHQHIQDYRLYYDNHYQVGDGDINSFLGFEQNFRREYDHPTDPDQAGMYVRLNTINYGLRYNIPTIINIEPTIGFNGMYQNNTSLNATDFPIPNYNLLDIGGYGYAKWKYHSLTLSGGIRYDLRHLSEENFFIKQNPANGFNQQVTGADTVGAQLQFPAMNKTFSGITSSIGATYRINEQISLKANIARGYRAPNISEIASNGLDPGAHIVYEGDRNAVPEFSLQEDLGLISEFKDATIGISGFNNNIQNYLYEHQLDEVIVPGNKTFQYQQADAQIYGGVGSLDIHPKTWKGFDFNNSFTLTYGFNRDAIYKNTGIKGEYLPFIPPMRFLSSISQELHIKNDIIRNITIKAMMERDGAQNRYLALYNTETPTPGYTLFNVSAITEIRYLKVKTIYLQVQVNNLFNTAYQSNLSRLKYFEYYTASPNDHLGIYDMGRNICLKLIIPF